MSSIELMQPQVALDEPTQSLYTQSVSLLAKLYCIPGFESFLFPDGVTMAGNPDPVSLLWACFRLGAPLCHLMNEIRGDPLPVPDVTVIRGNYNNVCKKAIFQFQLAAKDFGIQDTDSFMISELYKDEMSGFVKVLKLVTTVVDIVFQRNRYQRRPLPLNMGLSQSLSLADPPSDNRSKTIHELLETEKKYVNQLTELQLYADEIQKLNLLPPDLYKQLFLNLPQLLDFQRRFLLQMELCLNVPYDQQRIGQLFSQNETGFAVYEPFCGNYKRASQIIVDEASKLEKCTLPKFEDPKRTIPSYLIKPLQRICKYPLLMRELVKLSDKNSYSFYDELLAGEEAVKRCTGRVNERQRLEENQEVKRDLIDQIVDLKGLNLNDFGDLLLYDKFPMLTNSVERDYTLFLFERIMLCCKEGAKKKKKKKDGKEESTYSLKGNIYISSIGGVVDVSKADPQQFGLQVFWKDGADVETFALNCRNNEQVVLWMGRLEKLVEAERNRRRSVVDNLQGGGMRNRISLDDYEDEFGPGDSGYLSPNIPRQRGRSNAHETMDAISNANSSRQSGQYPVVHRSKSIPRNMGQPSWENTPPPPMPAEYLNRKSTPITSTTNNSQQRLISRPISESPTPRAGGSRPPVQHLENVVNDLMKSGTMRNGRPDPIQVSRADTYSPGQQYNNLPPNSPRADPNASHQFNSRAAPQGYKTDAERRLMERTHPSSPPRGGYRTEAENRFQSRFQSDQQQPQQPVYRTDAERRLAERMQRLRMNTAEAADHNTSSPASPSTMSSPRALVHNPSISSTTSGNLSLSSNGTSASRGDLIKVKTYFGSDIFVVAVSSRGCPYSELLNKIERKIRLCGALLPEGRNLRMKFKDMEGDYVSVSTDEDVAMAFETALAERGAQPLSVVNLYVQ